MMRAIISRSGSRTVLSSISSSNPRVLFKPTCRTVRVLAEKEDAKPAGHSTGSAAQPEIDEDFQKEIDAYKANEQNAARLTPAEELRTMVESVKFGTLSTIASTDPIKGDLIADGRATVTVMQDDFKSMADARGTITGMFEVVPDDERAAVREAYMKVHSDAYWVDFGDFDFLRMKEVVGCNLIAGFGRIYRLDGEEYLAASPDPIAPFSKPICQHMNDDHEDAIAAMVHHYAGIQVEAAEMLSVDRLGVSTQCRPQRAPDQRVNVRLSFPEAADTRKAVKDQLVAMTRAAKAAVAEPEAAAAA